MTNDIRDLLDRFNQIEEGQSSAQKSVHQLPALFKPKNISPVLGSKKDPKNPMQGYFVGGERVEENVTAIDEDLVTAAKRKLSDYLKDVANSINSDSDLVTTPNDSSAQIGPAVKTITTDDGHEIKIHGNEDDGFRITVKNKPHSARFKNLDEANMAVEMFCNRRRQQDQSQDYVEERS